MLLWKLSQLEPESNLGKPQSQHERVLRVGRESEKGCDYAGHNQKSKYINQKALGYSDTSPLISISSGKLSLWGTGMMTHLQYI